MSAIEHYKNQMKSEYLNYLHLCHTKPEEVKKDTYHQLYFYLDGTKIYVPEHYYRIKKFIRYKFTGAED